MSQHEHSRFYVGRRSLASEGRRQKIQTIETTSAEQELSKLRAVRVFAIAWSALRRLQRRARRQAGRLSLTSNRVTALHRLPHRLQCYYLRAMERELAKRTNLADSSRWGNRLCASHIIYIITMEPFWKLRAIRESCVGAWLSGTNRPCPDAFSITQTSLEPGP